MKFLRPRGVAGSGPARASAVVLATALGGVAAVALASCGGGGSTSTTAGTIPAAKALAIAKKSGAAPRSVLLGVCQSQPPRPQCFHAPPPVRASGDWYLLSGTRARVARDPANGIQFQLVGTGTGTAMPVGLSDSTSTATPISRNRGLFFANTYPATDTSVFPSLTGITLTLQLRTPQAPERFAWTLQAPGTTLYARNSVTAGLLHREHGSYFPLQVNVLPGAAHDSSEHPRGGAGRWFKTTLGVTGDRLGLNVPHRGRHLVYPVIVNMV